MDESHRNRRFYLQTDRRPLADGYIPRFGVDLRVRYPQRLVSVVRYTDHRELQAHQANGTYGFNKYSV